VFDGLALRLKCHAHTWLLFSDNFSTGKNAQNLGLGYFMPEFRRSEESPI
jgi:hypothetical protein